MGIKAQGLSRDLFKTHHVPNPAASASPTAAELQDLQCLRATATYLAGAKDNPVLVLRPVIPMVLQLLTPDADCHGAQLLIHPKVVKMF